LHISAALRTQNFYAVLTAKTDDDVASCLKINSFFLAARLEVSVLLTTAVSSVLSQVVLSGIRACVALCAPARAASATFFT
jgi:hypothetical protein